MSSKLSVSDATGARKNGNKLNGQSAGRLQRVTVLRAVTRNLLES
jgi:hypothetical protein